MSRVIPNEQTWFGFTPLVADISSPTKSEVDAAVNLTSFLISLNASSQGNTVPTPALDSLFETSIPGTVQASLSADFYRDNGSGADADLAWDTLPRAQGGYFLVSRFGGKDTTTPNKPTTGDKIEVWPVIVISRTMANMASGTAMTFTVTGSVPEEPDEAALIAA